MRWQHAGPEFTDSTPSVEICLAYSDDPNQAFLDGNKGEEGRKKRAKFKPQVPDVTAMKQTKHLKPTFRESQHCFCILGSSREDSPIVLETQFKFGSSTSEGSAYPFFQGCSESRSDPRARAEAAD